MSCKRRTGKAVELFLCSDWEGFLGKRLFHLIPLFIGMARQDSIDC